MSQIFDADAPLFDNNSTNKGEYDDNNLNLEKVKQDGKKFEIFIQISEKTIKWLLIVIVLIIILDILCQKCGFDDYLIKECFSLLKYSLTTVFGYVFAYKITK